MTTYYYLSVMPYIVKAGNINSIILFKNNTCHLYVLHKFAKEIRKNFLNRNKLIANEKKLFKSTLSRRII